MRGPFRLLLVALCAGVSLLAHAQGGTPGASTRHTLEVGTRPWKGDYEAMVKRRLIRVLVPYSKTFYYVERGRGRGISYDVATQLESELNKGKKGKALKVRVVLLPVGRDELIGKLEEGYGDVIIADLVATPSRLARVDMSAPMFRGVREIVVGKPGSAALDGKADLSGREVFVRKSSSYHESLVALNKELAASGKPPVRIREAPEELEAEDILEMVNAGLVDYTVVDRYKATMWSRVFTGLAVRENVVLRDDGDLGLFLRKDSPQLKAVLDDFVKRHAAGTTFGNTLVNRYVKNPTFVKNAVADDERRRFGEVVELFRKYGDQYGVDHLLMVAQGFQESGLDQKVRSHVGAIGVMQIMPATGKDLKVGDVSQLEPNIHGGVKYMRFMIDQYYAREPMTPLNKGLFAFAAYNAGPGRIAQLRKEAQRRGLDPNRWFHNVELVAADRIGAETVTYVSNIYKYYTAYKLIEEQRIEREKARDALKPGPGTTPPSSAAGSPPSR